MDHEKHQTHEKEIVYAAESYAIIGACFEVYKEKGCGSLEGVYQECLEIEFGMQGIPFMRSRNCLWSIRDDR